MDAMASIVFSLIGLPPSANKRLHHMARYRSNRDWKQWSSLALMNAINRDKTKGIPWERVHILYIFNYPKRTRADLDNLVGSMKPALDGIVGLAVVADDAEHVHELAARVEVVAKQPAGVTVVIEQCAC